MTSELMLFFALFLGLLRTDLLNLKKKFVVFTGMSNEEFEDLMTDRFMKAFISRYERLEIDISKYDKSHGLLALTFEVKLMRYFRVES